MPGFDRTGPRGQGPLTGRGMGYCEEEGIIPARGYGLGRGRGLGRGAGRGFGRGIGQQGFGRMAMRNIAFAPDEANYSRDDEITLLKQELTQLKKEKKLLSKRLKKLEK